MGTQFDEICFVLSREGERENSTDFEIYNNFMARIDRFDGHFTQMIKSMEDQWKDQRIENIFKIAKKKQHKNK